MGADADEKKVKRPPLRSSNKRTGGSFDFRQFLPTSVVTSPALAASRPGAIELGLLLALFVVMIYLVGFYEVVQSLPEVPKPPEFLAHVGQNLNLARIHEWDAEHLAAETAPEEAESGSLRALKKSGQVPAPVMIDSVAIPRGQWPVTLRDEDPSTYEKLIHPGDGKTEMLVPPFWSPPLHNKKFFTREMAQQVGTCIETDAHGNYNRGDDCPSHQRTIYVGIASYRDFECRSTAESIFLRATHPERIRIGVVDQIVDGEDPRCDAPIKPCSEAPDQALCKYARQIDVYQMAAELSIGPVFARHIGYRMYRGEYYATQSDAHVTYTVGWDVDILSQFDATHNDMAVLTTYLTDVQGSIDEEGHSLVHTRPIMCNTVYEGGPQGMHLRHASQPERMPSIHGSPQLQPWWAAGYSFSRGHFVVNVPYDWLQPMIFQGEEMSIGIRGFTVGYDYYAPERSVCFHHYATGKNAKIRNKVPHFWENDEKYAGTGRKAMQRLLGIVHMNPEIDPSQWPHDDEDIYGLGGVRTPELFYQTFGIDVVKKMVERHLCRFVDEGGKMHKLFTPFLRKDEMGIDYNQIHFEFRDPAPDE